MIFSRTPKAAFHLLMGFVLMLVYPLQPLFSGNQNVYFLWGMAKADVGSLSLDLLLQQADPFPIFSSLIYILFVFLHPCTVHLIYSLLCSIYSYSIFGIADTVCGIYKRHLLPFTAFFLVLHSSELWGSFLRLLLNLDLRWIWDSGIAEQGILRGYLQPSVFGVFLLLSIYRFLKNDTRGTFISLTLAGIFHANYLFIGGIMGVVYFEWSVRTKHQIKQTLIWSVVAISLVLPYFTYTVLHFLSATPEELTVLDSAVKLTRSDNPHLDLSLWFNLKMFLQFSVSGGCIFLFRKSRIGKLFLILTLIFAALSVIAFSIESSMLRSLNPWRISVVLVPIASVLFFWKLLSNANMKRYSFSFVSVFAIASMAQVFYRIFGNTEMFVSWRIATVVLLFLVAIIGFGFKKLTWFPTLKRSFYVLLIVVCISVGVFGTYMENRFRLQYQETKVFEFIERNTNKTTVFLIPPGLTSFRLSTRCAVVADENIVYGLSLSDQLQRISDAKKFYRSDWTTEEYILTFMDKYEATSILVPSENAIPDLTTLQKTYGNAYYSVLE